MSWELMQERGWQGRRPSGFAWCPAPSSPGIVGAKGKRAENGNEARANRKFPHSAPARLSARALMKGQMSSPGVGVVLASSGPREDAPDAVARGVRAGGSGAV
jgi:hypothetical protein